MTDETQPLRPSPTLQSTPKVPGRSMELRDSLHQTLNLACLQAEELRARYGDQAIHYGQATRSWCGHSWARAVQWAVQQMVTDYRVCFPPYGVPPELDELKLFVRTYRFPEALRKEYGQGPFDSLAYFRQRLLKWLDAGCPEAPPSKVCWF